jgi:hypothetical protein
MNLIFSFLAVVFVLSACSSGKEQVAAPLVLPSEPNTDKHLPFFAISSQTYSKAVLTNTSVCMLSEDGRRILWTYRLPDSLLFARVTNHEPYIKHNNNHVGLVISNIFLKFNKQGELIEQWKIKDTAIKTFHLDTNLEHLYYFDYKPTNKKGWLVCLHLPTRKVVWNYQAIFYNYYYDDHTIAFIDSRVSDEVMTWQVLNSKTGQELNNFSLIDTSAITNRKNKADRRNKAEFVIPVYSNRHLFLYNNLQQQLVWKSPRLATPYNFSTTTPPVYALLEQTLIYKDSATLTAVDRATQKELWKQNISDPDFKLKIDQYCYLVFEDKSIIRVDDRTGTLSKRSRLPHFAYNFAASISKDEYIGYYKDSLFYGRTE